MSLLQHFTDEAQARAAAGDLDGAIALYRRAREAAPQSVAAEHNLGVALAARHEYDEAAKHLRAALAKGGRDPATWLALARTLQGAGRLDEAHAAFQDTLTRAPFDSVVHAEFAQLVWMRTGSPEAARARVLEALERRPNDPALWRVLGWVLQYCGDWGRSVDAIAEAANAAPDDPTHLTALAFACLQTKARDAGEAALDAAEAACVRAPRDFTSWVARSQALLALGRSGEALADAERAVRLAPINQLALATLALATRAAGDPRFADLCDLDALVRVETIATPPGWATLDAYLADLAAAARRAHKFETHPFGNSVRHGSQAPNILASRDPALAAFPAAIDPAIRAHIETLRGRKDRPPGDRAVSGYAIQGAWSVKLKAGGFHSNHVHPEGWISSVCYLALPDLTAEPAPAGWLTFGEPNFATSPPQPRLGAVEPRPGRLVLFPSYFWHGTAPFAGAGERLTIAFDLIPA
ncbi:MAG: putative 2OG-Fe(II) oxygenase [Caulobacterales bacterium]